MKKMMWITLALIGFSGTTSAAVFKMKNSNNQDIWIAVAAWMTPHGSTNTSTKVHGGFYKLVPEESRVFFDNDNYDINTVYVAIAYQENGTLKFKQPRSGDGPDSEYFDLSIQNCTAYGNKYRCDISVQVLGGILTSASRRLHFDANSGVISHLREGKSIRFVGQKTSAVIPNDIDK